MKNLIISAVGDESLHEEWMAGSANFDLCLIYYGNNHEVAARYAQQSTYFLRAAGMKYHLISEWITINQTTIDQYNYIWMPDNDVSISTDDINRLFQLAAEYQLELCQPAMKGYISHPLTESKPGSFLRYTNFVEVLAPLMHINTLHKLKDSFRINYSGWGYDYLWPYLLGYPKNSIAIIDSIVMHHTKPIGADYSRFPKHPKKEMKDILRQYKKGLQKDFIVYRTIPG
ncbi:MAG: hypothetical protein ACOYVG_05995 [Bacteroidota bacterium]